MEDRVVASITVGVREAKGNLSRLLKQVREGVQVVITDRGEPVGRIVPVERKELSVEDRLKDLERRGILRARRTPCKVPRPVHIPKKVDLQAMLQEDRDRL